MSGIENTVKTDTTLICRNFNSSSLFQTEKKTIRKHVRLTSGEIQTVRTDTVRKSTGRKSKADGMESFGTYSTVN